MKKNTVLVLIMATAMFVTLVSMGIWQWKRLAWKQGILAQLEQNLATPPVRLAGAMALAGKTPEGPGRTEYLRVTVSGQYHHHRQLYYFAKQHGKVGWFLYTPLEYKKGHFLFINRGFIPDGIKKSGNTQIAAPAGSITITGLLRMGQKEKSSPFEADNAISKNQYFWRSIQDMANGAFIGKARVGNITAPRNSDDHSPTVLPFSIDLEKNDHASRWPKAGVTILKPANSHFSYMMTWFSFALTLLIITGFYLAGNRDKA